MASTTELPIPIPSSVSSVPWIGIARSAGGRFASAAAVLAAVLLRAAGYLWIAVAWLLSNAYRVAAWPVALLLDTLRVLLSPVVYTLSYTLIPLNAIAGVLARLRPLYTYLGSAAFIGILAGLVLKLASDYVVGVLGLGSDTKRTGDSAARPYEYTGPVSTARTSRLPTVEDDKSDIVQDDVWQWLDEFNPRQPAVAADSSHHAADAPSLLHRQRPPGLLSLTILEESSSEGGHA